ncbi:hypothetical protein BaRGS_00040241 [Batillaria attramentaria]|uniref:Uncharacterized protein n=1 Tax=Batillaria attramentaria TaxID=370345 RepID=A0ABD0J0S8_9CAEN
MSAGRHTQVTLPVPVVELVMRERENTAQEQPGSHQSAHYYMEVPDSPPPSDEEDVAEEAPLRPCHGPCDPPDDYLVPEPSRDETEEEGTEWKTVPFYENTQLRNAEEAWTLSDFPEPEVLTLDAGSTTETGVLALAPNTENSKDDDYVRHSPRLYENTKP